VPLTYWKRTPKLVGNFKPQRLFVGEGDSECLLLEKVLSSKQANPNDNCIFCLEGLGSVTQKVAVYSREPNFGSVRCLMFMVDAETDRDARQHSIRDACRAISFIPKAADFDASGIYRQGQRLAALYISPGKGPGAIEDLIRQEISGTSEYDCLQELEACLRARHQKVVSSKAFAQIYISLKRDRLCGVGRAFEANILDHNHAAYGGVVQLVSAVLAA